MWKRSAGAPIKKVNQEEDSLITVGRERLGKKLEAKPLRTI